MHPDVDCEQMFDTLRQQARDGQLIGAIVITLHTRAQCPQPYGMRLAGWARTNTTYALGAMTACMALLEELALECAGIVN